MLTAFVGHLVGKIGRVEERLIADGLDGERQGQFFGLDAKIDATLLNQILNLFCRILFFAHAELTFRDVLEVCLVRCMQSFEQKQQPRNAALEESDAYARKALEDAIVENIGT